MDKSKLELIKTVNNNKQKVFDIEDCLKMAKELKESVHRDLYPSLQKQLELLTSTVVSIMETEVIITNLLEEALQAQGRSEKDAATR